LKGTGTCKPEGKPTILKGITSGNLEGVRGSLFRRAVIDLTNEDSSSDDEEL